MYRIFKWLIILIIRKCSQKDICAELAFEIMNFMTNLTSIRKKNGGNQVLHKAIHNSKLCRAKLHACVFGGLNVLHDIKLKDARNFSFSFYLCQNVVPYMIRCSLLYQSHATIAYLTVFIRNDKAAYFFQRERFHVWCFTGEMFSSFRTEIYIYCYNDSLWLIDKIKGH